MLDRRDCRTVVEGLGSRAVQHLELRVPPLALGVACAAVIEALSRFVPAANVPFPGHQVLALAAVVTGIVLAVAGIAEFQGARTTINPLSPDTATSVVTSGVYRMTRNPMYLGMALVLAGVAAWRASLLGLVLVPVFCLYMTRFQIKPEERALQATFGQEFRNYMARVRRWM
jgi:protein-S-isoprenylcysteine O-methyltransferase Ste14